MRVADMEKADGQLRNGRPYLPVDVRQVHFLRPRAYRLAAVRNTLCGIHVRLVPVRSAGEPACVRSGRGSAMTIVRVHEAWCDSPNHSYTGTEIVKARGVQLVKVALRGRGWVCSNDNTNAICPECVAKAKQPRMETAVRHGSARAIRECDDHVWTVGPGDMGGTVDGRTCAKCGAVEQL